MRHKFYNDLATSSVSIRYIEINFNSNQYRLLKKSDGLFLNSIPFTVNGVYRTAPYLDGDGVNVHMSGDVLVCSTQFGLTLTWDGVSTSTHTVCDAYAQHVCGLCGNADGRLDLNDNKK